MWLEQNEQRGDYSETLRSWCEKWNGSYGSYGAIGLCGMFQKFFLIPRWEYLHIFSSQNLMFWLLQWYISSSEIIFCDEKKLIIYIFFLMENQLLQQCSLNGPSHLHWFVMPSLPYQVSFIHMLYSMLSILLHWSYSVYSVTKLHSITHHCSVVSPNILSLYLLQNCLVLLSPLIFH